jgi:hypothetical protein
MLSSLYWSTASGVNPPPSPPLDQALEALGPVFLQEVWNRLAPVRDRFFQLPTDRDPYQEPVRDSIRSAPLYLSDPELPKVAIGLAELALDNGIDINLACDLNGSTFLHGCVFLREMEIAVEAVTWLLAHGADPNQAEMMEKLHSRWR